MTTQKNGTCLKTKNGFMVNFHGFCFFVTEEFKYNPWTKTISDGTLPPTNEYGRLKGLGLTERKLSDAEEILAKNIAEKLKKNPNYGLPKKNTTKFVHRFNSLSELAIIL